MYGDSFLFESSCVKDGLFLTSQIIINGSSNSLSLGWRQYRKKGFWEQRPYHYYKNSFIIFGSLFRIRCHSDSFQFEIVRKTTIEHNRGVENRSAILSSISEVSCHEYDDASVTNDDVNTPDESYDSISISTHQYDDMDNLESIFKENHDITSIR